MFEYSQFTDHGHSDARNAYEMSTARAAEIRSSDERIARYSEDEILDYCCGDWSEGDAHQQWLDTAPAAEIASWALSGLEEIRKERAFEASEQLAFAA